MWVELTANAFTGVELFLKEDLMAGAGWSSCRYIPTSFAIAVLADLGCARIDVMKASDSIMTIWDYSQNVSGSPSPSLAEMWWTILARGFQCPAHNFCNQGKVESSRRGGSDVRVCFVVLSGGSGGVVMVSKEESCVDSRWCSDQ